MSTSDRDLRAGAGCVVALGVLGLCPALILGVFCGGLVWIGLTSPIDWSKEDNPSAIYLLIVLGYLLMLWQWVAFLSGWRTLLEPRRLWAVSSIYFIMAPALVVYENYAFLTDGEDARDKWTLVAMLLFLPVMFLTLTIQLWLKTPVEGAKGIVNKVADSDIE